MLATVGGGHGFPFTDGRQGFVQAARLGTGQVADSRRGISLRLFTSFWKGLRVADKLVLGFLAYVLIGSAIFPLAFRQRIVLASLNLVVLVAILLLSALAGSRRWLATLRDWFPAVLILVAYRESGLFFAPDPTHRWDKLFAAWDALLLGSPWLTGLLAAASPWLPRYLELSYLFCYPLVPLGFGALMLGSRAGKAQPVTRAAPAVTLRTGAVDFFWTAVLLATLTCYVIYPFIPLTPPRALWHDFPGPAIEPLLRKTNLWILDRYSVQACIFPSGHVAAVTAVALAVRAYRPRLGALFLIAAASVAVATVYGRYHYAADAVAGALVGVLAFLISQRMHR